MLRLLCWWYWRYFRKRKPSEKVDSPTADDFSILWSLCTVWPDGPASQAYFTTRDNSRAGSAATEVRIAIENSDMIDTLVGLDHIDTLKRIEHAKDFDFGVDDDRNNEEH